MLKFTPAATNHYQVRSYEVTSPPLTPRTEVSPLSRRRRNRVLSAGDLCLCNCCVADMCSSLISFSGDIQGGGYLRRKPSLQHLRSPCTRACRHIPCDLSRCSVRMRFCTPVGKELTEVLRAPSPSSISGQIWRCSLPEDRRRMRDDAMTHATHGLQTSPHPHPYQTSQSLQSAEGRHARPFSAWTPRRRPPPEGQDS